jgi:hypothetical protein
MLGYTEIHFVVIISSKLLWTVHPALNILSDYYVIQCLLSTTNKVLSNILLSRLTPYAEEIIGEHQCGFRRNRSTTDHIFRIHQIFEEKWEYNEAVHQLFIDFKKAYVSVRREALYNILIEFRIPLKLVRPVNMCLNETYSRVRVGKHLSDTFPIKNGLKQGDALSPLLWNMPLGDSGKPGRLEIDWYTSASSLC